MTGTTPKKGSVAEPGRSGQAPGSGEIITVPVCAPAPPLAAETRPLGQA